MLKLFKTYYEHLINRYKSLRGFKDFIFESEFLGDNSPFGIFINYWCKKDFVRIPSNIMDWHLNKLSEMEDQLNKMNGFFINSPARIRTGVTAAKGPYT